MIDVDKYLVHTADVYHVLESRGGSVWGDGTSSLSSTPVPTPCYAYYGEAREIEDLIAGTHTVVSAPSRWQVLLPPAFINTLKNGAKITNIKDTEGALIREEGYVAEVYNYRHHRYGALLVLAKLSE